MNQKSMKKAKPRWKRSWASSTLSAIFAAKPALLLNVKVEAIIRAGRQASLLKSYEYYVKELAKVENLLFVDGAAPEHAAVGVYKEIEVFVPLKDLIDVAKELGRIEKEIDKIDEESEKISKKLSNESFSEKAPAEVIAKNESRLRGTQSKTGKARNQQEVAGRDMMKTDDKYGNEGEMSPTKRILGRMVSI